MQTHTGIKFIVISSGQEKIKLQDEVMRKAYDAYGDYVHKNPFQEKD